MNLLSLNIKGGGLSSKRRRVSFLLQSKNIDICFLQETKLLVFSDLFARAFWGSNDVDWTACNSIGAV